MDPLNDMYDALASINNILNRRKQTIGDVCDETIPIEKVNNKKELRIDSSLSLKSTNTKFQPSITSQVKSTAIASSNKRNQLHYEPLTEDNFHCAHLCNRNIDELPNISVHDIEQLNLINIYTMQDLLGRFLIHDTPEEFYTFLVHTFHLNQTTSSTITRLFHQWTKHNVDGTIDDKTSDSMEIVH